MERAIITISESGRVNIPSSNVWMSEMELVELFGVIAPTLRSVIKAIYKSGMLCPVSTQRCDLATPASWATFYNLEVIIALQRKVCQFYYRYPIRHIRRHLLPMLLQQHRQLRKEILYSCGCYILCCNIPIGHKL